MEKKRYIQPAMKVLTVRLNTLLAGSGNIPDYNPSKSFNEEESVGARRGNFWDDEDEEEDY